MTFAVPLSQVPHALAAASGPGVATMFPLQTYSSASVQHFNVIFEESLTGVTEQQIMIDGTAPGCTRVPFRASGVVFDVAVSGCGDGDVRNGAAGGSVDLLLDEGYAQGRKYLSEFSRKRQAG